VVGSLVSDDDAQEWRLLPRTVAIAVAKGWILRTNGPGCHIQCSLASRGARHSKNMKVPNEAQIECKSQAVFSFGGCLSFWGEPLAWRVVPTKALRHLLPDFDDRSLMRSGGRGAMYCRSILNRPRFATHAQKESGSAQSWGWTASDCPLMTELVGRSRNGGAHFRISSPPPRVLLFSLYDAMMMTT
jgi:hypothetical protein